jgi:ParB-like chromosome segregation protein Spo0J
MKLETVPLSAISPDPANVRKHSPKNIDAIKASLRRFGQQKPIVVDAKGIVLAGNGTLTAARDLGWKEIQIVRTDLTGTQATAFGIADNRSAELAEWDDKLAEVLASLEAEDFPLAEIGFDEADLAKLQPPEFAAGTEADQGKLDQLEPKMVCCPHCKKEFDLREHGQG